jgi:serine/threonine protein kinase/TPR repeat protein
MSQGISTLKPEDPDLIGGWKLKGRIGQGGFGTIYVGTKDGLSAAIKLISRESIDDQESIPRFANEVRSLNQLNHPGIPKLIDHNLNKITATISPYIAVTYFEGKTFQELMDMGQNISETVWLDYLKSLVEILIHCHKNGVIHRDISPSNIIITNNGPKLIDFGFSYLKGSERLSQQEVTVGTPPFRSPEHHGGEPIDAMDIFSLASVFTFIATGEHPFPAEQDSRYRDKILYESPRIQKLTENQKSIITPLFYKNATYRPSLSDIAKGIEEIQSSSQINNYKYFLKDKDKKLKDKAKQYNPRRKLLQLASIIITTLGVTTGIIYLISSQSATASECKRLFQLQDFEKAITVCGLDVAQGRLDSQVTLGRAFKAIKQEERAKEVFSACKDTNYECLSENAYFISDVNKARSDWILAFENGVADAGVALAISFNKANDEKTGNLWMEKAISSGSKVARLMKVASLIDQKQYKEAIIIAKQLRNVDLSAYPRLEPGFNIENIIISIYELVGDLKGKKEFLEECSVDNGFCIGKLADEYRLDGDYVNAEKWALKGMVLNDAISLRVLGDLEKRKYFGKTNTQLKDAEKAQAWYEKAAIAGDVSSMVSTAGWKLLNIKRDEACVWWNRIITTVENRKGSLIAQKGDPGWASRAAESIQVWKCGSPLSISSSPSPNPKIAKKSASPNKQDNSLESNKPALSYSGFGYSEELSPNVKVSSIFGRAYLGTDGIWNIPITNDPLENVPPINRVQFRNSSEPFGSWWNIGYQLKKGAYGYYAEVSELGLQLLFSKDSKKVCPEFRLAIVENNLVTYIWNKSVEPCSIN